MSERTPKQKRWDAATWLGPLGIAYFLTALCLIDMDMYPHLGYQRLWFFLGLHSVTTAFIAGLGMMRTLWSR